MGELTFSKYAEFKCVMDAEIKGAVQGFVNIGYLLKVARDTNILAESGYKTVAEFAKAEYGLTKDVVSRYIRINDRFSKDGYSMELKREYEDYGIGKLQEMLALPDEINDVLTPELSKEQIAETRREYQEEQQITDMEVMLEEKDDVQQSLDTTLEKAVFQYLKEQTEVFKLVDMVISGAESIDERSELLFKALAPKGFDNLFARIPGEGKIMIIIAGRDKDIITVNMRTGGRETYGWPEMLSAVRRIWTKGNALDVNNVEERYGRIYGEMYKLPKVVPEPAPEKKVAPVQPKKETPKPTPKKPAPKKEIPVLQEKPVVQQEEENDVEENSIEGKIVSLDAENEAAGVSEVREPAADIEPDEQHSKAPVQRQSRQEMLEARKQEIVTGIHRDVESLRAAVLAENWNAARLRLADIKSDVEQIEQIEDEIEDLLDISQMRIEDYEQKEE